MADAKGVRGGRPVALPAAGQSRDASLITPGRRFSSSCAARESSSARWGSWPTRPSSSVARLLRTERADVTRDVGERGRGRGKGSRREGRTSDCCCRKIRGGGKGRGSRVPAAPRKGRKGGGRKERGNPPSALGTRTNPEARRLAIVLEKAGSKAEREGVRGYRPLLPPTGWGWKDPRMRPNRVMRMAIAPVMRIKARRPHLDCSKGPEAPPLAAFWSGSFVRIVYRGARSRKRRTAAQSAQRESGLISGS